MHYSQIPMMQKQIIINSLNQKYFMIFKKKSYLYSRIKIVIMAIYAPEAEITDNFLNFLLYGKFFRDIVVCVKFKKKIFNWNFASNHLPMNGNHQQRGAFYYIDRLSSSHLNLIHLSIYFSTHSLICLSIYLPFVLSQCLSISLVKRVAGSCLFKEPSSILNNL